MQINQLSRDDRHETVRITIDDERITLYYRVSAGGVEHLRANLRRHTVLSAQRDYPGVRPTTISTGAIDRETWRAVAGALGQTASIGVGLRVLAEDVHP